MLKSCLNVELLLQNTEIRNNQLDYYSTGYIPIGNMLNTYWMILVFEVKYMLPKGLELRLEKDVLYWENVTGFLTEKEAMNVSKEIKNIVDSKEIKAIVVDNRKLTGVWTPEVDQVFIELMSYLPNRVDRTVTLCQNVINKLQVNYLSKQAGTVENVKAFVEDEQEEVMAFLELPELHLK